MFGPVAGIGVVDVFGRVGGAACLLHIPTTPRMIKCRAGMVLPRSHKSATQRRTSYVSSACLMVDTGLAQGR